jgi:hypothetical protein
MGLNSQMQMGEAPITVALACAQCGQTVASGSQHECPTKEKADAEATQE